MKKCWKCSKVKLLSDFNKCKTRFSGVQDKCKQCWKEYRQTLKYKESKKKSDKKYRDTNRKELNKKQLEYQKTDKGQEVLKKNRRKYDKLHPEKANALNAKKRASKLQATPKWLTKEQLKEIEFFYHVAAEFKSWTKVNLEVDHIVPLQGKEVCGLHVPWNLQILPRSINASKGNKLCLVRIHLDF